jgi:hypothetical protein
MRNWRYQLRALPFLLLVGIPMIAFALLMNERTAYYIMGGGVLGMLLPVVYLHIEYLCCCNADQIVFRSDGFYIYTGEHCIASGSRQDVRQLYLYKSHNIDRGGIVQIPTEYYFFVKVVLQNGDKFIVTCLTQGLELNELRNERGIDVTVCLSPFASINTPIVWRRVHIDNSSRLVV